MEVCFTDKNLKTVHESRERRKEKLFNPQMDADKHRFLKN